MKNSAAIRITCVWGFLLSATLASWAMGHGWGAQDDGYASAGIICISFVKVRFVLREFMDLRRAPLALQYIADGWVVLMAGALIGFYFLA